MSFDLHTGKYFREIEEFLNSLAIVDDTAYVPIKQH